ncbi:fimbrial protein [Pragia fontium]|uniref:fimbrial protein n=1 Tax=Pragia fontium TaxID=82985 RepID=UPI00064B5B3E|nr:fimbrial protein [Pragia fontium]AKJ43980.1 fimbrial protein [Pragia fontium]
MNKNIYGYLIIAWFGWYSPFVAADTDAYAYETLPDTKLSISLEVVNITCDVNDGEGLDKIVDFKVINEKTLLAGKQPAVKAQFIVDCRKSGVMPKNIDVKLKPGSQGALNNGTGGELQTNLSGVGINLSWPDGTPVDLSGKNKRFTANNNQFDISFYAKPYAQGQSVEKGIMKSSVIIDMLYK